MSIEQSTMEVEPMISFTTCDDVVITTTMRIAKMNETIKNLIEDLGFDETDDSEENVIPLPNINSTTLIRIFEYCENHVDDEPKAWEKRWPDEIDASEPYGFDAKFVAPYEKPENLPALFDIISAADFLNNKKLLDLCCKKVAYIIKDKKSDEIRNIFCLENDFDEEEWKQVSSETTWCE